MKFLRTTRQDGKKTCATTEPVADGKPALALLIRLLWAAALVLPAFDAEAGVVVTGLYSFQDRTNGANPFAELVQGRDGFFYGTTPTSRTNNGDGTVFKISPNGALTTLYSVTGGNDGGTPYAGLVQGRDGNFYGTTWAGGTNGYGTVFRIGINGALTSLYSFTGGNDSAALPAGLVQGRDGYLYGTIGGPHVFGVVSYGNVFRISTNGALTTLYSFTCGNDGAFPYAGLVQDCVKSQRVRIQSWPEKLLISGI
jgi:uncharacterized repeat protein (TIGR03803 family)